MNIFLNINEELNKNYDKYKLKVDLFPSPLQAYNKFVSKNSERHEEFKDWFNFHDKIIEKLEPPLLEFQKEFKTEINSVETQENTKNVQKVEEIPFSLCLDFYTQQQQTWNYFQHLNSSQKFFNNLIKNEKETVLNILNREFLIPKNCSFFISDISNSQNFLNQLGQQRFEFIIMDPPWENKSVNRSNHYNQFNHLDLFQIPVTKIIDQEKGGYLAIWVTNRLIFHDFILNQLFPKWNITFLTHWYWMKIAKNNDPVVSLHSRQRKPYEMLIIGSFGNPKKKIPANERIIFCSPTKHSQKPPLINLFQKETGIDQITALEIFSRNLNSNCISWGNEVLKFQHLEYFNEK
eukprot:gene1828-970_t